MERKSSILASKDVVGVYDENGTVFTYTVFRCESDFVQDLYYIFYYSKKYTEIEDSTWDANKVLEMSDGIGIVLVYDDMIFEIEYNNDFTADQIALVKCELNE